MTLMLLSLVANNSTVQAQPNNKDQLIKDIVASDVIMAAHWNEDKPVQGGWIFVSLVRDSETTNQAVLYVSGYHPAGVVGKYSATFSGVSPVNITYANMQLIAAAETNFQVTYGNGQKTIALHNVTVSWSIPIPQLQSYDLEALKEQWIKGIWTDTTATININIVNSKQHFDLGSSDWATIGLMSPQQTATAGHWIVNFPTNGGWIFAAVGQSKLSDDAWIYVAGYRPANTFTKTAAVLFEGLNTDVNMKTNQKNLVIEKAKVNFTQCTFNKAKPTILTIQQEVSFLAVKSSNLKLSQNWDRANDFITISNKGNWQQFTMALSSFALIDFNQKK
jgi:hypothetical protein